MCFNDLRLAGNRGALLGSATGESRNVRNVSMSITKKKLLLSVLLSLSTVNTVAEDDLVNQGLQEFLNGAQPCDEKCKASETYKYLHCTGEQFSGFVVTKQRDWNVGFKLTINSANTTLTVTNEDTPKKMFCKTLETLYKCQYDYTPSEGSRQKMGVSIDRISGEAFGNITVFQVKNRAKSMYTSEFFGDCSLLSEQTF